MTAGRGPLLRKHRATATARGMALLYLSAGLAHSGLRTSRSKEHCPLSADTITGFRAVALPLLANLFMIGHRRRHCACALLLAAELDVARARRAFYCAFFQSVIVRHGRSDTN